MGQTIFYFYKGEIKMDHRSIEVNKQILMELGFEIGPNQKIFDQNTCMPVQMNGKYLVAPGCTGNRISQEFDAYNNPKMMHQLFSHFAESTADEEHISSFYHVFDPHDKTLGAIECTIREDDGTTSHITSGMFHSDSVKYLDLLRKINRSTDPMDMNDIDYYSGDRQVKKKKNAAAPKKNKRSV